MLTRFKAEQSWFAVQTPIYAKPNKDSEVCVGAQCTGVRTEAEC